MHRRWREDEVAVIETRDAVATRNTEAPVDAE
jgi:hypothetical protein